MNYELFFMWYKNVRASFFRFVTMHVFVRRTDRRTEYGQTERPCNTVRCITCSRTVKIEANMVAFECTV